jgi:hypothetical protein
LLAAGGARGSLSSSRPCVILEKKARRPKWTPRASSVDYFRGSAVPGAR